MNSQQLYPTFVDVTSANAADPERRMFTRRPRMSQDTQVDRIPWNKGRLIGPKPLLKPKHVWGIRIRL